MGLLRKLSGWSIVQIFICYNSLESQEPGEVPGSQKGGEEKYHA
jgi:hypothetical protein